MRSLYYCRLLLGATTTTNYSKLLIFENARKKPFGRNDQFIWEQNCYSKGACSALDEKWIKKQIKAFKKKNAGALRLIFHHRVDSSRLHRSLAQHILQTTT